jgi:16S rRNA (cytidine1402-2'-O)-methyltransferase
MSAGAAGCLHLVAVPIGPGPAVEGLREGVRPAWSAESVRESLPAPVIERVCRARYFLVENARSARAFLKAAGHPGPMDRLQIVQIGHEPAAGQIDAWLAPLLGENGAPALDAIVLSEAGCPGIADPGARLVARAHELGIGVQPWPGPSSIVLALMGSGMNGQRFRFHGYLPQDREELRIRLLRLQEDARGGETQIFIETPYRNVRLFDALLQHCGERLRLCLAVDLGGAGALLRTRTLAAWRALPAQERPELHRRPAVFLLHGN